MKRKIIATLCFCCLFSTAQAAPILRSYVADCPSAPVGAECRKAAAEAVDFWRALPSLIASIAQGMRGAPPLRPDLEAACARFEEAAAAILRAGGTVGLNGGWVVTRDAIARYKEKKRTAQRKALFKTFAKPSPKGTMKRVQDAENAWVYIVNDNREARGLPRMDRSTERRARFEFDCLLVEIAGNSYEKIVIDSGTVSRSVRHHGRSNRHGRRDARKGKLVRGKAQRNKDGRRRAF